MENDLVLTSPPPSVEFFLTGSLTIVQCLWYGLYSIDNWSWAYQAWVHSYDQTKPQCVPRPGRLKTNYRYCMSGTEYQPPPCTTKTTLLYPLNLCVRVQGLKYDILIIWYDSTKHSTYIWIWIYIGFERFITLYIVIFTIFTSVCHYLRDMIMIRYSTALHIVHILKITENA